MRARPTMILAVGALLAAPRALGCQTTARDSVTAAASAFLGALADAPWRDAATYLDLAPFEAYRRELVRSMHAPRTVPTLTVERVMTGDPDMPRAVAECQLQRMQRAMSENEDFRLREFADVPSVDSLAARSTEEAAVRWLQAKDPRWLMPARGPRCASARDAHRTFRQASWRHARRTRSSRSRRPPRRSSSIRTADTPRSAGGSRTAR